MKKQTKLVAVLSTASLLAIGASMTSFAATGWAPPTLGRSLATAGIGWMRTARWLSIS